ncbi:uncharacterized protein DEA37_0001597, partial [Paragonimus westermani]
EEALKCTGNKGLDAAMEWYTVHYDVYFLGLLNIKRIMTRLKRRRKVMKTLINGNFYYCSKSLRNEEEVQIHSARTGHVNYSESAEEVKPLTDEERKAQMEKLQDLLRQKKLQRDAQEKQEELEREKRRRKQGKDIVSAKAKFEEDEIRRMVEQKRREKEEDRAYRERLKADIARERAEKKMKDHGEDSQISPVPKPVLPPQPSKSDSTVCRLQIRLPSGPPMKAEFGPSEPLSAVILYISQRWPLNEVGSVDPSSVQVLTTFPKRDFGESDLQVPLSELGMLLPNEHFSSRRL